MDNMTLIKRLPPMLSGDELEKALSILPEYAPNIVNENEAMRLIALSDLYKVLFFSELLSTDSVFLPILTVFPSDNAFRRLSIISGTVDLISSETVSEKVIFLSFTL